MIYVGNTKYKMYVGSTPRKFQTEKEYFYVFHSATGIIERHKMQNHFNLYELVGDGYIYEGYSFDIGRNDLAAGDYGFAIKNGTFEEEYPNIEWVNDKLQDVNFAPFDGTSLAGTGHSGTSTIISVGKAQYVTLEKADNVTPIPGAVYYLIEVDASKYSRVNIVKYGPSKDSEGKYNSYLIFARTATAYYQSVKVYVDGIEIYVKVAASFSSYYYLNGTRKTATFNKSGLGYRFVIYGSSSLYYGAGYNEAFEDNTIHAVKMVLTTLDGMEIIRYMIFQTGNRTDNAETGLVSGKSIEYLENGSNSYIDLDYIANNDTAVDVKFQYVTVKAQSYIFSNSTAWEGYFALYINGSSKIAYSTSTAKHYVNTGIVPDTNIHVAKLDACSVAGKFYYDNRSFSFNAGSRRSEPTRLFAAVDKYGPGLARIYYIKFIENGIPVLDLTPVKIGVKGYMLDYVEGKLYGNAVDTEDFVLPPEETNETE